MAECGVPRDHISHTLNHTIPGAVATRVYDRYSYDAEKRVAVETWNRELQRILAAEPKPTASIVPISTNRRRA